MDDRLKEIVANYEHADPTNVLDSLIIEVEQLFYDEFRDAYLKEFRLDDEHLSVNDIRILKLAAATFGVEPDPDRAIGQA